MRLVKNLLIFLISLYIGVVLFMPKENLYYLLEKEAAKQGVIIYNEEIKSNPLRLEILNPIISYEGIDIAQINEIKVTPLLAVNQVEIKGVEFLNIAKDMIGEGIEYIKANHSILKPYWVKLDIKGDFGVAKGYIDLKSRLVHIDIVKEKNIAPLKSILRKSKQGWYYEYRF